VLGGIDAPAPAHTPTTSPPQRSGWKIFPFTPLCNITGAAVRNNVITTTSVSNEKGEIYHSIKSKPLNQFIQTMTNSSKSTNHTKFDENLSTGSFEQLDEKHTFM